MTSLETKWLLFCYLHLPCNKDYLVDMRMKGFALSTVISLTMLTGCNSSAPPEAAPRKAVVDTQLREIESAWMKDVAAKDLDKIMANYGEDAALLTPGAPAARGKDAVREAWKGMLDSIQKLEFVPYRIELSASGDMATTLGAYSMSRTDPKTKAVINDRGSYLAVYRKQSDGSWKAIEDIVVSEVAPR